MNRMKQIKNEITDEEKNAFSSSIQMKCERKYHRKCFDDATT